MSSLLATARRILLGAWLALIGIVLTLVLATHLAGLLGHRLVIIRGASMTPAIPLGSLAFEQATPAEAIVPGDAVTLALPQGATVTHRVTRVAAIDGRVYVETKGDANATVDRSLQPVTAVIGVVRFSLPMAGFALAFLGIPTGILSVLSMLGSLLMAAWLLQELEAEQGANAVSPSPVSNGLPA